MGKGSSWSAKLMARRAADFGAFGQAGAYSPSGPTLDDFDEFMARYSSDYATSEYAVAEMPPDRADELMRQNLNSGTVFQLWLDDNNDYGAPNVVSDMEINRLIDEGATPIYRGMPDSARSTGEYKLSQVMQPGKYYTGTGVHGDGLYFGDVLDVAGSYAADNPGATGSVMRAVLAPNAKVVSKSELRAEMKALRPDAAQTRAQMSAFARARGYDVITQDNGQPFGVYYVILNRSAIIMGSTIANARGGSGGGTIDIGGWRL